MYDVGELMQIYRAGVNTPQWDDITATIADFDKHAYIYRTHIWPNCGRDINEECTTIQKDYNLDTYVMASENVFGIYYLFN